MGSLDTMRMAPIRDIIAVELHLREPLDPSRLNGCGLLIINPPYRFESEASAIAEAVLRCLGATEPGASTQIVRVTDE